MNDKTLKTLEYNIIIDKLQLLSSSDLGREAAGMLKPSFLVSEIQEKLCETEDAVLFITSRGAPPLSGIKDIRPSIRRADTGGILNFAELLSIAGVLKVCRKIKDYSSQLSENTQNRIAIIISLLNENRKLEERIYHCIISEEEMSDEASTLLYDIRKQIRDKQNLIKDKLNDIIHSAKFSKQIQEPVVTLRGDRYCIPVKIEARSDIPGLVHDISSSGQTLFVEPMAVVEANNKIRELRAKEQHEIDRILYELAAEVSDIKDYLLINVTLLTSLDFIFSRAKLALDMKCIKPHINTQGHIDIVQGRHPLLNPHTVVPMNFKTGYEYDTLVITGPNTGGKTVALKTVGLFALMAQSGLLIPAKAGTTIPVYKHIYADIGDEQSIAQSLSTFSSHMNNIVSILREADNESLVLLDELGAGTDPTEGAALAMSILECLHQTGSTTIATTHYSELKIFASTTKGFENACCEFDVQTLSPTYRLLIGVPGKSNAFAISQRIGLDSAIISRAREFLTTEDLRFEDMLQGIESNRSKIENERYEIECLKEETFKLQQEIKLQKDSLEEQHTKIISKSREDARELIGKAKKEADKLLIEIRKSASYGGSLKDAEVARNDLISMKNSLESQLASGYIKSENDTIAPKILKLGDSVRIVSVGGSGTVLKVPDRDGNVFIQAGILKINVHISDLRLANDGKIKDKKVSSSKFVSIKAANVSTELSVRGLNVEDAKELIDKYLDDVYLAHLKHVTIIHGKGTGALRAGLQSYFRQHKRIASFRLGAYGEGDAGVTIVELK